MAKVNINAATAKELSAVKGIGLEKAKDIIAYRKKNGAFQSKRELLKIDGIKQRTYEKISPSLVASNVKVKKQSAKAKTRSLKSNLWKAAKITLAVIAQQKISGAFGESTPTPTPIKKRRIKQSNTCRTYKFDKNKKTKSLPKPLKLKSKNTNSKRLTDNQIQKAADENGIEYAALKAVIEVESAGSGFLKNGKTKILFEGHIFWNQLQAKSLSPSKFQKKYPNIVYPKWTKQFYIGGAGEYKRLKQAVKINEEAALKSASWGMFQIMGFNHYAAGYNTVTAFVKAMQFSEENQLNAFLAFVRHKKLKTALKNKQWAQFAKAYNGAGFKKNQYDTRLKAAYQKYNKQAHLV